MIDEIQTRIRRIYVALNAIEEEDLEKLKGTINKSKGSINFFLDFSGGLSKEELSNDAHNLIHNIANLEHNLRKWAANNSKDKEEVNDAISSSLELRIIKDLSNNDKHGYGRNTSSGLNPRLESVNRVLRIEPNKGSSMGIGITKNGAPKVSGSGSAKAIVTGCVVDSHGNSVGYLYEIALKAIQDWETLLVKYGLF